MLQFLYENILSKKKKQLNDIWGVSMILTFLTNTLPSRTCRQIELLEILYSFPFDSCERMALYFPSSSRHTEFMLSISFVLSLYFSAFVSMHCFPVSVCFSNSHVICQQERSAFFTFASNCAARPQITLSSPFMKISGLSVNNVYVLVFKYHIYKI